MTNEEKIEKLNNILEREERREKKEDKEQRRRMGSEKQGELEKKENLKSNGGTMIKPLMDNHYNGREMAEEWEEEAKEWMRALIKELNLKK